MRTLTTLALLTLAAAPLAAQQDGTGPAARPDSGATPAAKPSAPSNLPPITLQHVRPMDRRGVNMFETPKHDDVPYTGFRLDFGAAFTQQFQGLGQRNTAAPNVVNGANTNQLVPIGHGFNNAVANAYLGAQLAKGIRVAMTSYLSARHHNETWVKDGYLLIDDSPIDLAPLNTLMRYVTVKDGYLLIDDSPIDLAPLNTLMRYVTVKAGHFEINYGDAHFRRTDNGNAMYNPLVGNYLLDAFVPQIGGEVYLHGAGPLAGAFVMGSVTSGEEKGMVQNAAKRAPAFVGKLGVDRQLTRDLRARLTGSLYSQARSANEVLYSGDRAGSRYYSVMTNSTDETATAWTGAVQPFSGPSAGLHAAVVNPFLKYRGLEYFGTFEQAKGRGATEPAYRTVTQVSNEVTYRFLGENLYVSGRTNTVSGRLAGIANDVSVKRSQLGGGWFVTPTVLTKLEWVHQKYLDFPTADIRHGGQFKGFMVEGTVAF